MFLYDAHKFQLRCQGSVYTHTIINLVDGSSKLLVATLNRELFCFDLSMTHMARPCGCVVVPQTKQLQFTYLPTSSEIVSIHAFNKSSVTNDFVIGVTIVKSVDSGECGQYINIYSDWQPGTQTMDDCESEHSCLSLELDFIPYQLAHVCVDSNYFWILGGSDNKIHVFSCFSETDSLQSCQELEDDETLPEFRQSLPSVPLCTDILTQSEVRTTATVCEDGYIIVYQVDVVRNEIMKSYSKYFAGPLTGVMFITPANKHHKHLPSFLKNCVSAAPVRIRESVLSLVVGYSLDESVVFTDLEANGLDCMSKLTSSLNYDCVTCVWVDDITLDGRSTILLGTYGQEVLAYVEVKSEEKTEWTLSWQKSVSSPILGIRYADLTGDGVKELIVVTTTGVQVLQHDLEQVKKIALSRLNKLTDSLQL